MTITTQLTSFGSNNEGVYIGMEKVNEIMTGLVPPINPFAPRNGKKKPQGIPEDLTFNELREFAIRLAKENADLKSNKKFGLVWEDLPDEQVNKLHMANPTLVECEDKAVVTDGTDINHILINGDNFHALTALRASHTGKVDVIYLDPPYNTGNKDFIYNDSYIDKEDGYYHSKWLSFMEKRLLLAQELLSDSGVIFVSIDDNEQARLKLLMDSVFGAENFVANNIWLGKTGGADDKLYSTRQEYIVAYSKKLKYFTPGRKIANDNFNLLTTDGRKYKQQLLRKWGNSSLREDRPNMFYPIIAPDGSVVYPIDSKGVEYRWRWGQETMEYVINNSPERISFKKDTQGNWIAYENIFEDINNPKTNPYTTVIESDVAITATGSKEIKDILGSGKFSYPKSSNLITEIINRASANPNAIVLDFFAGSGTTAHAVAELNKEDGGNRQCILVTDGGKTETVGQSAKNAKNNTVNIAEEITYERVRRVLTGKDWADGKEHEALGGNLRYFKIEMQNVEGLTDDDQKGILQPHLVNHAMVAENAYIKVLTKTDDSDSLYPNEYTVLTNSDESKYVVVIVAHDHKLSELNDFIANLPTEKEVVLMGERIEHIDWIKKNITRFRIDRLMDKTVANRKAVLNSSIFN